jgi:hypothetical protein
MTMRKGVMRGAAIVVFASVGLAGLLQNAKAVNASNVPVAVELFTSQGCSSCPAADALLARLAIDSNIVAITRPVTYWDNLGWKDTLAREDNSRLQRAYAARGGPDSSVYTPQAMVQGGFAVVGSSESKLRHVIAVAGARAGPNIVITAQPDGSHMIAIDGPATRAATIDVVALRSSASVRIGNGENSGRTIHYTNVVVGEQSIGRWSGGRSQFKVPYNALHVAGADRAAVLVQQGEAGPILAARYF